MIAEAKELVLLIGLGQAFENSGRGGVGLESRMWGFCTKTVGCACLKRSRQCLGTKCFRVASFAIMAARGHGFMRFEGSAAVFPHSRLWYGMVYCRYYSIL